MNARLNAPLRAAAVAAVTAVIASVATTPAYAADGDVKVVNTETVQVYTSPTGQVQTRRVYEQLAMTGNGSVDLKNPISTDHLRNLDGFGGFDVKDGEQLTKTTVDGEKKLRSVSDFNGKLPLDVSVAYKLDGKNVKPGDLIGKDGKLEVVYTVENVTGTPQEVSFPDGKGGTVTKTVDVPIPMVGSLSLVAPSTFTNVSSQQANIAGDGKGGTKLSFTMTLFPPIGSTTAVFGYTADVTDGVVPRAEISALPVNPMESPTFKTAATSYKGGADTGAELTDGAAQIDENLLKLRDGAGDLLAGLIKLRDGAGQLNAGLAGEAVPGSEKLAAGAAQLSDGLTNDAAPGSKKLADGAKQLSTGLGQLNSGSKKLAAGTGEAFAGSKKLDTGAQKLAAGLRSAESKAPALIGGLGDVRAGLVLVDQGLTTLYDKVGGIPAQAQPLFDGIAQLKAGIGDASTPDTLIYGVNAVRAGLTGALPKIQLMADGVYKNSATDPGAYQKLGCAVTVLNAVKAGTLSPGSPLQAGTQDPCFATPPALTGPVPPLVALSSVDLSDGATPAQYQTLTISSVINGLIDGRTKLATPAGDVNETTLYGGLMTLKEQLQHFPTSATETPGAIVALASVQCGLDNTALTGINLPNGLPAEAVCKKNADGTLKPGLKQGLGQVSGGIDQLVAGVVKAIQDGIGTNQDLPADQTLRGGMNGLISGVDQLSAGGGTLVDGLGLLSDGSSQLAGGTEDLRAGLGKLNTGAGQLASGAGDAADGSGKISDGASKLASGLEAAADGSGLLATGAKALADGLKDAADGSGQLVGGLATAADGAPKLVDGAQRLSDEGTKKLIAAGTTTAQSYGELYATMTAGAKRAQTEDMAFGAPSDAVGLTAYSYVIQGDDGEGGRNLTRGLGGLAILGAGGAVFGLRRRFI